MLRGGLDPVELAACAGPSARRRVGGSSASSARPRRPSSAVRPPRRRPWRRAAPRGRAGTPRGRRPPAPVPCSIAHLSLSSRPSGSRAATRIRVPRRTVDVTSGAAELLGPLPHRHQAYTAGRSSARPWPSSLTLTSRGSPPRGSGSPCRPRRGLWRTALLTASSDDPVRRHLDRRRQRLDVLAGLDRPGSDRAVPGTQVVLARPAAAGRRPGRAGRARAGAGRRRVGVPR